ncbi:PREDICTED: telomere-associated protein RIF1-like [Eufriesea mexicana]|uniref:telomere-associated protein RIF1-like n=1 Tax=Eufriesea mexicana TaxID=516756 RepID=UPI00083C1F95|nr:PREDICTED: telomere-associated protein RIF1-like [Eufriesea mexicana]
MASNVQSFPRMLKMLRENSNTKEKREALTYIRSNSKKLESTKSIKEEQYKELCKLIIDVFATGNNDIQNEAYETLTVVIQEFKDHTLNLFEAISQISQKNRLKILKLLEVVEDNAISTFASDPHAVIFFNNCMCTIQTNTMPWTAPTACVDNLQALIDAESKPLSDDQRLEEETVNYCVTLLRRLYKVAAITSDIKVQRFHALLMDKITLLAYMGHKRQRGPALKLLQQALATNMLSHVRTKLTSAWTRYIAALQSTYCKRMLLLVSGCELDWATQWNVSIQFLGMDLHRGAGLINNLLSVEEKAFKSTDAIIRRQAFLSWKLLVDNFALDSQELATARRIKLLCIPLNAKNSKTELIALTKLEVWWHVIIKLYKDITKFVNPVITQFLNFCFGPLGDTPLLSSKFDIVASPGKRFFKTKVVAVDALCQLLVTKQENHHTAAILEERLPHPISDVVFQECYKSIIHSVGEALLVLSQLTDAEMKNRYQLGKILWTNLVSYIQESKLKEKENMYKDMILVTIELTNYAKDKLMIKNLILDMILFQIADLSIDLNFQDDTLSGLVFKLLQIPVLDQAEKKHYNALKNLFWQSIKSRKENMYHLHAFSCLKKLHEKLHLLLSKRNKNDSIILELWLILADVLGKYMSDIQEINEGSSSEHNLKTVESIVMFPFMYLQLEDQKQVQELAKAWKYLYRQFEMRTDLMTTVKSNEILLNVASVMQNCLTTNQKSSYLIINCLDFLLSTINYKLLLANAGIPSIIHLIVDLITYFLCSKKIKECETALKALSAVLVTIFGHNSEKIVPYLQICKPVIKLMLQSDLESLYNEIASTWEGVVNIFKGLGKLVDYNLLSDYKKLIILALNHPSLDIQVQTVSLFELQNGLNDSIKLILEEIEKETRNNKILCKIIKKKNDQVGKSSNQLKIVGTFVRATSNQKLIIKEPDKIDKKALIDADSQGYVFIKTDLKFDVNRLTEHQKESLKRKREDIPALYNDLSQSSSQDTQNLQEWFDKRNKMLEETEKGHNKKDNSSIKNMLDDDANKENKIEMKELETINKSTVENDTKSTDSVGPNMSLESVQKAKCNIDNNENSFVENETVTVENVNDNAEAKTSVDSISKDLNATAQEEFLENKADQRLSPSVLDSGKRRNRFNVAVKSTSPKSEEIVNSQPGQSNITQALQRTLRTKVIQGKSEMINKQKTSENMENKVIKEDKRGIKRKSTLDSENEGTSLRQRRRASAMEMISDSDSCKSTDNDNVAMSLEEIINESNLSQRTKNEISRLRINMVFDSPLSRCRRSKGHEDNNKETFTKKLSLENKGAKLKSGDAKVGDIKKTQKINEKELKGKSKIGKIKKIFNKKSELEEQTEEETIETEEGLVETKTCSENDVRTINNIVQDAKFTEGKNQVQNDMEDIIEDSQAMVKLDKGRLFKAKVEVSKIEDIKKVLQNKTSDLEGEKEEVEKEQAKNVQTEVTVKISDDTCNLSGTNKFIKTNVETVNYNRSNSDTQSTIQDVKSTEGKTRDNMEDIIENSQELPELEKKFNEKQYFIKLNRIEDTFPLMKYHETTIEDEEVAKIVSNDCDSDDTEVPKYYVKGFEEVSIIEPKISTPVIENNLCDNEKDAVLEAQKVNDGLQFKSLLELSSPKSNVKRQTKFKCYPGRAAHMLGLVTKQARMEAESNVINFDDEHVAKKLKSKDADNDVLLGKKEQGSVSKEVDKVTACSSRQEKIFSNMRSTDYCSSPPIKLFSNLKNDGEKIFSKTDKSVNCLSIQTDAQIDKIDEEAMLEGDELPILEWSSANPPSLTASPSASILKRQRQSIPEPDPESITPNKRKRVSFADPPVSKEMGYEITSTDSPHKANKFTSRGLLTRKDSPLRLKQIKQKITSTDTDKLEKDEEVDMTNVSEVDLQCERENELLTKIAEELEYSENVTIDTDIQTSCNSVEDESTNVVPMISNTCNEIKIGNLNVEYEITGDSTFSKRIEPTIMNKIVENKNDEILKTSKDLNVCTENNEFDDSTTQEDIFIGVDATHNDYAKDAETISDVNASVVQDTSVTNKSLDLLNVRNNSLIEYSSEKHINSANLDDTVDVANFTELNSSANSDEIFCGKLIRTSTQRTENIQEQDTLPVTDSIFGSLPLSQDSQNTNELNVEISHPELLDSIHPIYPTLILCKEPITSITDHLTNPLWVQHLSAYFTNRNVQTVGDLARLPEREVNRIPVKGNSKVEFVKSVLKSFEKKYVVKVMNNITENVDNTLSNKVSYAVNINVSASTPKVTPQDQVLKIADEVHNKLINHGMPLSQSSCGLSAFKTFKKATEITLNEPSNIFIADTSKVQPQTYEHSTQTTTSKSSNMTTMQIINEPISSAIVTVSASENIIGNTFALVRSTIPITQVMKTVGTCTSNDSIYLAKTVTNKATKSVSAQMALEDLLDEIDVNLVLESAARRCTPEKILMKYKNKMRHVSQVELESETIKLLGAENRKNSNEVALKAACRACGVNKVLLRLPDIFSADKQFFIKVLNAYRKKIKTSDCLDILDFDEVKDAICQKCMSSELAEMLSTKLKEEEQQGIKKPMTELSSLDAMLKRMPMDVIISHTVANDELIPSRVVLDIALQNNSPSDIAQALESQSSPMTKNVFNKLWSSQFAVEYIDQLSESKEDLLKIFKAISSKLSEQDFLQAFYESMNMKLMVKKEKD